VRFYAGYPLEAPDGRRVGALCIVDTSPRSFSKREAALLRGLTLRVQHELWFPRTGGES
jgi:GAF domain-containing protein